VRGNRKLGSDSGRKAVLNLYSKVSVAVLHGTIIEACISTAVPCRIVVDHVF
jgi:hypothetical protein